MAYPAKVQGRRSFFRRRPGFCNNKGSAIWIKGWPPYIQRQHGKWGLFTINGQQIMKPEIDHMGDFYGGLADAKRNGKWGFINSEGQWAIEPGFDLIGSQPFFNNNLAAAEVNGKWGLINKQGQWVLEPVLDKPARSFGKGWTTVKTKGKWGVINEDGQWFIKPEFNEPLVAVSGELARLKANGKWGLINSKGQWVVKPKFCLPEAYNNNTGELIDPLGYTNSKNGQQLMYVVAPDALPVDYVNCYIDGNNGVYRTGLNKNDKEPGFRWDFSGGYRTLFNRRGDKILTIDLTGDREVAKNASGEIIWPLASSAIQEDIGKSVCMPPQISLFSF